MKTIYFLKKIDQSKLDTEDLLDLQDLIADLEDEVEPVRVDVELVNCKNFAKEFK